MDRVQRMNPTAPPETVPTMDISYSVEASPTTEHIDQVTEYPAKAQYSNGEGPR